MTVTDKRRLGIYPTMQKRHTLERREKKRRVRKSVSGSHRYKLSKPTKKGRQNVYPDCNKVFDFIFSSLMKKKKI